MAVRDHALKAHAMGCFEEPGAIPCWGRLRRPCGIGTHPIPPLFSATKGARPDHGRRRVGWLPRWRHPNLIAMALERGLPKLRERTLMAHRRHRRRFQYVSRVGCSVSPHAGDFYPAFGSFRGKSEFDCAAKLKWNEFANYIRPIARLACTSNRRTVNFLPFDDQPIRRSVLQPPPSDRHATRPARESTVLCRIGRQLVNNHGNSLSSLRFQR